MISPVFPDNSYIAPSQAGKHHSQLMAFWPQGARSPLFKPDQGEDGDETVESSTGAQPPAGPQEGHEWKPEEERNRCPLTQALSYGVVCWCIGTLGESLDEDKRQQRQLPCQSVSTEMSWGKPVNGPYMYVCNVIGEVVAILKYELYNMLLVVCV